MADTATVKMRPETRETLREIAQSRGTSMQDLLDRLVEDAWRAQLFDETADAFAKLRADSEAWSEEIAERQLWESTDRDGVD